MANMCEVDVRIMLDGGSIDTVKNFVKNIDTYIPPTDDAIISVDDIYYDNDFLYVLGEARWSLRKEDAVKLITYFIDSLKLDVSKTYIKITYLERGFQVGGMYVLSSGSLKQGDKTDEDWNSLKRFNIDADNVPDVDWDGYWNTLYKCIESVDLTDLYDFSTKNFINKKEFYMIKGPELKEKLNNMSEEELSLFSASIITDESIIRSIMYESRYYLDFHDKHYKNDSNKLDEIKEEISPKLIMDTVFESWYEAYENLDDPYGYEDAFDSFISDVEERLDNKIRDMIENNTNK